jgi:hypothetical protein
VSMYPARALLAGEAPSRRTAVLLVLSWIVVFLNALRPPPEQRAGAHESAVELQGEKRSA